MKTQFFVSALLAFLVFAASTLAQETWQSRPSGVNVPLWSVAYGDGQWVAVGEQGTILTSMDGTAWTVRSSGFPARWLVGVGYGTPGGSGLWVVVGESGLILTSPDAVTWTARRTAGPRINAVSYGNGTFVAADDAGEVPIGGLAAAADKGAVLAVHIVLGAQLAEMAANEDVDEEDDSAADGGEAPIGGLAAAADKGVAPSRSIAFASAEGGGAGDAS